MDTSRMTTRLVGAALAALALLPATAQAAALAPLKPCYVSATQTAARGIRSTLDAAERLHARLARRRRASNGTLDRTLQADAAGNLPPQRLQSPYQAKGQGTFTLTAAERGNPANTVALPSRTTALTLKLKPKRAKPSKRIRFKGAGFTAQKAVWAHYLYKGKVQKTVRVVKRIKNPCGTFSVKRKQIPIKRPKLGVWRLQVDQQKRYSRAPDGVNVRADIKVQKVFT